MSALPREFENVNCRSTPAGRQRSRESFGGRQRSAIPTNQKRGKGRLELRRILRQIHRQVRYFPAKHYVFEWCRPDFFSSLILFFRLRTVVFASVFVLLEFAVRLHQSNWGVF